MTQILLYCANSYYHSHLNSKYPEEEELQHLLAYTRSLSMMSWLKHSASTFKWIQVAWLVCNTLLKGRSRCPFFTYHSHPLLCYYFHCKNMDNWSLGGYNNLLKVTWFMNRRVKIWAQCEGLTTHSGLTSVKGQMTT